MAARPDVRFETAPMEPVSCETCGTRVMARKSSWDQTSLQWSANAMAVCVERHGFVRASGPNGGVFPGCNALRASVREAAVRGDLGVVSTEPLPTNTTATEEGPK